MGPCDVFNLRLLDMDENVDEVDEQSIGGSSRDEDVDEEGDGGGKYEEMLMDLEISFVEEASWRDDKRRWLERRWHEKAGWRNWSAEKVGEIMERRTGIIVKLWTGEGSTEAGG